MPVTFPFIGFTCGKHLSVTTFNPQQEQEFKDKCRDVNFIVEVIEQTTAADKIALLYVANRMLLYKLVSCILDISMFFAGNYRY